MKKSYTEFLIKVLFKLKGGSPTFCTYLGKSVYLCWWVQFHLALVVKEKKFNIFTLAKE